MEEIEEIIKEGIQEMCTFLGEGGSQGGLTFESDEAFSYLLFAWIIFFFFLTGIVTKFIH